MVKDEKSGRGRPRTEYYFTIEIAKHIALASRTEKGRAYRQALIDLENRQGQQVTSHLLSNMERVHALRARLELAQDFDLIDDYMRVIAREEINNGIRDLSGQKQLPEKSVTDDYFMVEDLKKEFNMSEKRWFGLRSTFGKVVRAVIQAADESVKPLKVKKFVNGGEHEVNAWPNEYRDIAIAAIERYIGRQGD